MKRFCKVLKGAMLWLLGCVAVLAVCVATLLLFRIRIATAVAKAILPHAVGCENAFRITRLGMSGIEMDGVRLAGFPMAPSADRISIIWSPSSLREHRIASIEVLGLSIDPAHKVENFAMPSLGGAGEKPLSKDILQGWKIDRAELRTETVDFAPLLGDKACSILSLASCPVSISLTVTRSGASYALLATGKALGEPLEVTLTYDQDLASGSLAAGCSMPDFGLGDGRRIDSVSLHLTFAFAENRGIDMSASGGLRFDPCSWQIPLRARIDPVGGASVSLSLVELPLSAGDPLVAEGLALAKTVAKAELPEGLDFAGELTLDAALAFRDGAPSWSATGRLSRCSLNLPGAMPVVIENFSARGSAMGSGAIFAVNPISLGFDSASAGLLTFGKSYLSAVLSGNHLMVTQASVAFCGGAIRLYALTLNLENLATGFTLFLDNLHMGEFIAMFPGLEGSTATGRLHGRIPLRILSGPEVRLGESFIYTPPGESGNVKISNPQIVASLLGQAGIPAPVCRNIETALGDLDYEIFRVDLSNPRQDDGRMAIRLQGKSASGAVATPVNINANINGPIEKFLNLALKTAKIGAKK